MWCVIRGQKSDSFHYSVNLIGLSVVDWLVDIHITIVRNSLGVIVIVAVLISLVESTLVFVHIELVIAVVVMSVSIVLTVGVVIASALSAVMRRWFCSTHWWQTVVSSCWVFVPFNFYTILLFTCFNGLYI